MAKFAPSTAQVGPIRLSFKDLIAGAAEVMREKAPTSLPSLRGNSVLLMNVAIRSVDYARLKSFLGILAESQRLMDVLSVQFSPQALTATIRLRAYTLE